MSLLSTCIDALTARSGAWRLGVMLLALTGALCSAAEASTVERLVMPAPVIRRHAKYQDECSRCHRPFQKDSQRGLCLECHEKAAEDVKKDSGFHGLSKEVRDTECRHCHTDHKGRDFDVVLLDKELFDHGVSDYPLKGGHARVRCEEGHRTGKKWREAPSGCMECHEEDDPHRSRLG